eukprot:TRINITY_DN7305_c0_g1_i1.p3 TRINITY_DN7305_c0_g1~~TRINITY_DN7305_c0_g1_i1.p3  ORF type:complete len:149 (-),score=35.24 TRINITY_DN7305_c0_g1_i1:128-574(-)
MLRPTVSRLLRGTPARLTTTEIAPPRSQQFHKRLRGQLSPRVPPAAPVTHNKFALGFKPRTDYEDFNPFGRPQARQDWFDKLQPKTKWGMRPATRMALGLMGITLAIYGYCFYRFGQDDFSDVVIPQRPDIKARAEKQLQLEHGRLTS